VFTFLRSDYGVELQGKLHQFSSSSEKCLNNLVLPLPGARELGHLANARFGDVRKWSLAALASRCLYARMEKDPRIRLSDWEGPHRNQTTTANFLSA
jgi:hypothetical protein